MPFRVPVMSATLLILAFGKWFHNVIDMRSRGETVSVSTHGTLVGKGDDDLIFI